MPLNIKHLFKSDLDPNTSDFWSVDKIDKLNHNFRQVRLGGPQGPIGRSGFSGEEGDRGEIGSQGLKGSQGAQGHQGNGGIEPWKNIEHGRTTTILPKFNGTIEYTAIPVVFGAHDSSPVYTNPIPYSGAVLNLYAQDETLFNLSLDSDRTGRVAFDLNNYGSASRVEIKELIPSGNFKINYQVEDYLLKTTSSNVLSIKDAGVELKSNAEFQQDVDANSLSYNNNPSTGYIMTSGNSAGDVNWRYKYDIFPALPIGSISSIPYSEFNSANFYLDEVYNNVTGYIEFRYGRGKEGGKYEGWYLCHGLTWHVEGIVQYEVPNLNSFQYDIDPHNQQPQENGGDSTIVVLGGADILMDSDNANGQYQTNLYTNTNDQSITLDVTGGANVDFNISRNVHIVYLGIPNMIWQTTIIPTVTESINLAGPSTNYDNACLGIASQYLWTGIGKTWTNLTEDLTGIKLYTVNNQLAPANRWYASDGVARYWTGTSFTSVNNCPVQNTITLEYDVDVTELNGTVTGTTQYVINNLDFSLATTLLDQTGSAVSAGWYREVNADPYSVRRFWDGSNFVGSLIDTEFVYYIGPISPSIYLNPNACSNTETKQRVYAATNNSFTINDPLNDMYNSNSTVMVHLDWLGTTTGESPLINIYEQNRPNSSNPYRSLVDNGYRANIKTTSKIQQPVSC